MTLAEVSNVLAPISGSVIFAPWQRDTLFQDVAATVPVTDYGQPVDAMLDVAQWRGRSVAEMLSLNSTSDPLVLPGHHAIRVGSDAARPIYARHPATGTRNRLTHTEDFSNPVWVPSGLNAPVNMGGGVWKLVEDTATDYHLIFQSGFVFVNENTFTIEVKGGVGRPYLCMEMKDHTPNWYYTVINLADGDVSASSPALDVTSTPLADGWFRISGTLNYGSGATLSNYALFLANGPTFGDLTYTGDGTSGVLVRYPQAEPGAEGTAYQKVTSIYDVTEVGVPDVYYLACANSAMATPSIDLTAYDRIGVFVGQRKLSDATTAALVELGNAVGNSFLLLAPRSAAGSNYGFASAGSNLVETIATGYAAPHTAVLTGVGDISGDKAILRLNGVQGAPNDGDQGSGPYGNHPLYLFGRAGSSLHYAGNFYGMVLHPGSPDIGFVALAEALLADAMMIDISIPVITPPSRRLMLPAALLTSRRLNLPVSRLAHRRLEL